MIILLLIILGILSTPAQANHGATLEDAQTHRALWLATKHFHLPLGCSHVVMEMPEGGYGGAIGMADMPGCNIWVRPDQFPQLKANREQKASYCTLVVHEFGHNKGYDHSPNPRDVMFWRQDYIYPPCWTTYCYWHAHIHKHGKRRHVHRHCHAKVAQP